MEQSIDLFTLIVIISGIILSLFIIACVIIGFWQAKAWDETGAESEYYEGLTNIYKEEDELCEGK